MLLDRMCQSLLTVLYKDTTVLRIVLCWFAITLGYGFIYSNASDDNYTFLVNIMTYYGWAVVFIVYGICMHISSFYKVNKYVLRTIDLSGMWLWTYLFLSFNIADYTESYPIEFTLIVPIIVSIWLFIDDLFKPHIISQLIRSESESAK